MPPPSPSPSGPAQPEPASPTLVYCHCKYAKVLPAETKAQVLDALVASGQPFEAVADLCELSARKDPALGRLAAACASGSGVRMAACFPRAVEWLFHAGGHPLPLEQSRDLDVVNLRDLDGRAAAERMLGAPQPHNGQAEGT